MNLCPNGRSISGLCDELHVTPGDASSLFHGDQAKAGSLPPRCFEIETNAIVGDGQLHLALEGGGGDREMARLAVRGGIPHRFLRYSKQTQRRLIADAAQVAFGSESHFDAVLLFDFKTVRVEGATETDMAQCAWVQVMRETADTVDQPEGPALKYGQRFLGGDLLNVASPPFQVAHRD